MAANQRNIESIAVLRSQGYSQKDIAAVLGRNPSVVSQIARGKKPYDNLESQLTQMARQAREPAPSTPVYQPGGPARRQTTEGEQASVRQSRRRYTGGGYVVQDESNAYNLRRDLIGARNAGLNVRIILKVRHIRRATKSGGRSFGGPGRVQLFEHGFDAGKALRFLESRTPAGGDIRETMMQAVMELSEGTIESISGFVSADIIAFPVQQR